MWGDSKKVIKEIAYVLWTFGIKSRLWEVPIPPLPTGPELRVERRAHEVLLNFCERARQEFVNRQSNKTNVIPKGFYDLVTEIDVLARNIHPDNYRNVAMLWRGWEDIAAAASDQQRDWLSLLLSILSSLHLVLGSERRVLVGVRGGRPTFKELSEPLLTPDDTYGLIRVLYSPASRIEYIGPDEIDLMPDPGNWRNRTLERWPETPLEAVNKILETAFYNQRYIVHPQGAYVKLLGHPDLTGLFLKVRRSINDPSYVDFLARVETVKGQFVHVLDGGAITGTVTKGAVRYKNLAYLDLLIAQIYHDLVTSKFIWVEDVEKEGPLMQSPSPAKGSINWIYIPRVVKGRRTEPRLEIPSGATRIPHQVSGYKRKGNMSDEHRKAIQEFEEETGLDILSWIPDGYTFVRPHISPQLRRKEMAKMPNFIRSRLQADLQRILECK